MKKHSFSYILLMLILVSVLCPQISVAQQQGNQYALYNYRNDGQFNAWLNIDVDSITYSRIDTLGIEHDDVVVQEVWTPDSLYRIPLEAIDSIGFRAPEPQFKGGIYHVTKDHCAYVIDADSLNIVFSSSIPLAMLPQKGQVVISDIYGEKPFESGFAGRVKTIVSNDSGFIIECEEVSIDDIYDKLICVGRTIAYCDDDSTATSRRKISINKDGTVTLTVGKATIKLKDPTVDSSNMSIDLNISPSFSLDYTFVYNVEGVDNQFKLILSPQLDFEMDYKFKAKIFEGKILKMDDDFIPLNTNIPGFYAKLKWGAFFDYSGDLSVDGKLSYTARLNVGYDSKKEDYKGFVFNTDGSGWKEPDVSMSLNGSMSFGPAFQLVGCLVTEKWLPSVTITAKPGLKLSGKFEVNDDMFTGEGISVYDAYKNSKLSFAGQLKFEGEGKVFSEKLELPEYTLSPDWLKTDFYLFPKFTEASLLDISETGGDKGYSPSALYSEITRDLFLPTKVGLAVYDLKGNRIREHFNDDKYMLEMDWSHLPFPEKRVNRVGVDMKSLPANNTYKIYPIIRNALFGEIQASPLTYFQIPQTLSLEQSSLSLSVGEGREVSILQGWGDYRALNMSPDIISTQLLTHELDNGELAHGVFVEAKKSGQAFVIVQDIRSEESVTLVVKVEKAPINRSTIAIIPTKIDFGEVAEGSTVTRPFVVKNTGDYELTFSIAKPQSPFDIPEAGKEYTLAAGASKTIEATCTGFSSTTGSKTQFIHINSNAQNADASLGITLTARSVAGTTSAITVSPTEIDFGSVEYGTTKTRELKVSNTGDKSLAFYVSYQGSNAFSINDIGREFTLGPGDFKPYTVTCNGMQSGESANGEIHVVTTADNNVQKVSVKASGDGHIPLILERTSIEIEVDESANIKILQGSGSYNLSNSDPDIVDASLSQTNGIPCVSIKGLKAGTSAIQIKDSSTGDTKTLTVTVVFVPSTWAIDIAEISFGTVPLGTTKTAEFNVINTGDRKLTFKISTNTSPFIISNAGVTITLAKGGMQAFTVTCNGLRFGTEASVWVPIEADASNYGEFSGVGISANGGKLSYVPAEAIDLGLPSGTKWASYNVGAAAPDEYGGSYAWGETDIKDSYSWSNYKYCNGSAETCINIGDDISGTQYDVATQKWGNGWQMPTSTQFSELEDKCTWEWTTQNGIKGQKVTGPNGNSIFLPAVGSGYDNGEGVGSTGYYWTSTLYDTSLARDFIYYMDFLSYIGKRDRCSAHAVRPVKPFQETPSEGVDLGLPSGTKWASHNVGAAKPEDIGEKYAWGETKTKSSYSWGNYTHSDGSKETCHDIGSDISGTEYDVAFMKWGEEWQMPNLDQCKELINNCTIEHTIISGADGYRFTGPNGNSIFLPVAENMPSGMGHAYWSSTADDYKSANTLRLSGSGAGITGWPRYDGFSVRPVMKSTAPPVPSISVTPTEIDFGVVAYGTDETKTFTVNNTGNAPLTFTAYCDPYITGFEMADHGVEFTLEPGTSKNISVTCHGIETGSKASTNIVVVSNAANSTLYVKLSVVGTDSEPLIEATSLNLFVGDKTTLAVRTESFAFSNSNPDIVSVSRGGSTTDSGAGELGDYNYNSHTSSSTGHIVVEALAVGQATIKVTDNDTGKETILTVTVTENSTSAEAVDLGLPSGTRWASCNVGATKPEEFGGKYAWGETEVKEDYTEENYLYSGQNLGSNICGTEYDVAHVTWGGNWQMPTKKQIEELISKCTYEVVVVNGISGGKFTGPNGNSVFFPAQYIGRGESFWSGTPSDNESEAYVLNVQRGCGTMYDLYRYRGCCVRPVEVSNMIPPTITVVPEDIHFGVVKLGTDMTRELTVTNTCNASVTVKMDGCTKYTNRFDVSDNQEEVILAPGESKVYTVTAHGTKAGYAPTQSLLINYEGMEEPIEVRMSSYGDDDNPIIDVTELSLNIGETAAVKVRNSSGYSSIPDVDDIVELHGGGGPGGSSGPSDRHHPFDNFHESEMTVKALKAGVVHITFTDLHTYHTSVLTVTVTGSYTNDSILVFPDGPVDMGLPSGTLWASHNVGATRPEEIGGYYAWGETEVKEEYEWATYVHCDGTAETCRDIGSDISGTEYDVAHVKWGDSWQMPTRADFLELRQYCVHQKYTLNGVQGVALTSPNGNCIFMPCPDVDLGYWTSIEWDRTHAYFHGVLYNDNDGMAKCTYNLVRPVKKTN